MTNGRILIVEWDAIIAWDLAESLELAGYDVCCTGSRGEALREARKFHPEMAIVDADVRESLDAAAAAELLYEEHLSSVVYLTELSCSQRPAWLAAALPLVFLGKPFSPSHLLTTAAQAIAMHRAPAELGLAGSVNLSV